MDERFGTEPHRIIRRDAPDTSVAAGHRVDTRTDEASAYWWIEQAGLRGMTSKELAAAMGKPLNAISGRLTALRAG